VHFPGKHDLRSTLSIVVLLGSAALLASPAEGVRWPWSRHAPWPSTSREPVGELGHPPLEPRGPQEGYRFVAYGDQRALADGEWQEMVARIEELDRDEGPIAFVLDTGDVVADGRHTDQFAFLARLLAPIDHLPYLLGVGNHEVRNNKAPAAREHTAAFFARVDPDFARDRMWYRKDLGAATFLFLDSNDLVYGAHGDRERCPDEFDEGSREGLQLRWLEQQLAELGDDPGRATIVAMHHPFVQSSEKHLAASRSVWNVTHDGRRLADVFADGGVDVILVGHTHTYERFRLARDDGREMVLVNVSGRPRDGFLWFGSSKRRARDLRGREDAWLEEQGWNGVDRWEVTQEDWMAEREEANQFGVFDVEPDGGVFLQVCFLDEDAPGGLRRGTRARLH